MEIEAFYKHENCMDAFIFVNTIMPDNKDDHSIIVYVDWMCQGTTGYWTCQNNDRFLIKLQDLKKWKRYRPQGEYRYA